MAANLHADAAGPVFSPVHSGADAGSPTMRQQSGRQDSMTIERLEDMSAASQIMEPMLSHHDTEGPGAFSKYIHSGPHWEELTTPHSPTAEESPGPDDSIAFTHREKGNQHVFVMHKASDSEGQIDAAAESKFVVLRDINSFCFYKTYTAAEGAQKYDPTSITAPERLPTTIRPSLTLLRLLGMADVPEGARSQIKTWHNDVLQPQITLSPSLQQRTDKKRMIIVNSKEITRTMRRWRDQWLEQHILTHETDPEGAAMTPELVKKWYRDFDVRDVYGKGQFKIRVGELQKLLNSTVMVTSRLVPRRFVEDLIHRFTKGNEYSWYLQLYRNERLSDLAGQGEELWRRRAEEMERTLAEHVAALEKVKDGTHELLQKTYDNAIKKGEGEDKAKEAQGRMKLQMLYNKSVQKTMCTALLRDLRDEDSQRAAHEVFKNWVDVVIGNFKWWGFESSEHAQWVLKQSMVELSTYVCVAQKGHFLTGGKGGHSNQLCSVEKSPVVFLSAPGIDFCTAHSTMMEGSKYFEQEPGHGPRKGWKRWKSDEAKRSLLVRIRSLYEAIFRAAKKLNVKNPSMLPLGLGVFLQSLKPSNDSCMEDDVVELYFRAQFELLSEVDWGFETYWINAQAYTVRAVGWMQDGLQPGGEYNNPAAASPRTPAAALVHPHRRMRCHVVFHNRDAKFLASEVAKIPGSNPAFLNPSDARAVLFGSLGMYWMYGRYLNYVGEEDWGATSTGVLGDFRISAHVLKLSDISVHAAGRALPVASITHPGWHEQVGSTFDKISIGNSASMQRVRDALRELGVFLEDDEFERHMQEADKDKNGQIDEEEFKNFMLKVQGSLLYLSPVDGRTGWFTVRTQFDQELPDVGRSRVLGWLSPQQQGDDCETSMRADSRPRSPAATELQGAGGYPLCPLSLSLWKPGSKEVPTRRVPLSRLTEAGRRDLTASLGLWDWCGGDAGVHAAASVPPRVLARAVADGLLAQLPLRAGTPAVRLRGAGAAEMAAVAAVAADAAALWREERTGSELATVLRTGTDGGRAVLSAEFRPPPPA